MEFYYINESVLTFHYLLNLNYRRTTVQNKGQAMCTVYIHKIHGHILL